MNEYLGSPVLLVNIVAMISSGGHVGLSRGTCAGLVYPWILCFCKETTLGLIRHFSKPGDFCEECGMFLEFSQLTSEFCRGGGLHLNVIFGEQEKEKKLIMSLRMGWNKTFMA